MDHFGPHRRIHAKTFKGELSEINRFQTSIGGVGMRFAGNVYIW